MDQNDKYVLVYYFMDGMNYSSISLLRTIIAHPLPYGYKNKVPYYNTFNFNFVSVRR